jgi:HD superfamily phosphohydrolase
MVLKVYDCIFGSFNLPTYLDALLTAPEFRRLSEIRLININSPSLSSLSETKRYSHTLGVLRLALANPMLGYSESERKALLAAIVVHDAATPAFAHLFEYFLSERFDWDHEMAIPDLLSDSGNLDRVSTQIYYSQTPKFKELCRSSKIDFDVVMEIVGRRHPLSRLVFGSIDFDNLDNVARMNWMLGEEVRVDRLMKIAENLGARANVGLLLPQELADEVRYWLSLRKRAYEVLVFDGPTVAAQAVLSKAIRRSLENGTINLEDWTYTDAKLVDVLRDSSIENKRMLDYDFIGELPKLCLLHRFEDPTHKIFKLERDRIFDLLEDFLDLQNLGGRVYGYAFRDKSAFGKRISAMDPTTGEEWAVGESSNSLVVYGFCSARRGSSSDELGRQFSRWIEKA